MSSCAFQDCTSTWVLFAKYFKQIMLPHPQSVAKTGSTLPAFQRECQLRSSAFPNQTENLSLRCLSRIVQTGAPRVFVSRSVPQDFFGSFECCAWERSGLHCYIMVGGDRGCAFKSRSKTVIYSPHIMPSCAFQNCTSTWVLFAKYFNHSMLPCQQSVAGTGTW